MKHFLKLLSASPACLAALAGIAWMSAGSANAQEAGNCSLALSESMIDLGRVMRSDTSRQMGDRAMLGKRTVQLTLTCKDPEALSLQFHAAASGSDGFQLVGSTNAMYTVTATNAVLDGEGVALGVVDARDEAPSVAAQSQRFRPGRRVVPVVAGVPASGSTLSMTLEIEGWAPAQSLRVADAVQWRSNGLIESLDGMISSEVEIGASIAPVACAPTLSHGGVVDLGEISPASLNASTSTVLPKKTLTLWLYCDDSARFAFSLHDERAGSVLSGSTDRYGLGLDGRGGKIGEYEVVLDPGTATATGGEGTTYRLLLTESPDNGASWMISSSQPARLTGNLLGFTDVATSNAGPEPWTFLTTTIDFNVTIAPLSSLATYETIRLDGAARLLITYL